MKRSLCLPLLFSFLFQPTFSKGEDEAILKIRKQYEQVELAKMEATAIKFEFEDDPLEGKVTFWRDKGQIRKIVLESGAEHGGSTESFYYWDGKLFFVLKEDTMWRFSGGTLPDGQSETLDTLKEMRFYFDEGKCIRSLSREAQNTRADLLGKQILDLPNAPFSDGELISRIKAKGEAIFGLMAVLG